MGSGESCGLVSWDLVARCQNRWTYQRLIVELASNPSTGYEWQVAAVPAFLTIEDDGVYLPDAAPAGLVGSGGVMRRSFQANATGQGELKLVYVHPWETDATPAQTFVCPVRVESTNSSQ